MLSRRFTTLLGHLPLSPNQNPNPYPNPNPNPRIFNRAFALWSMKKDPSLESALSRNRRWIVNNQIKQILLRSPNRISTVRSLQKNFKTLDLQGRALNWLNKYPCCFQISTDSNGEIFYSFSKRMEALVDEEKSIKTSQVPSMARRLAKLLMLSRDRRLNVLKLNELKRGIGLPDDYIVRVLANYPQIFRVTNRYGRRNSMEIELIRWDSELALSAVETAAIRRGEEPCFSCLLPRTWLKARENFERFNESLYVSPYCEVWSEEWEESEKRAVGVVHEILSLMLWKKASILKLEHFRREFGLPLRLNMLLLRHPCIFYVSNRYKIYTVVLREGYEGSKLLDRDPLVIVKEKFGELMQEGLHEYNRRRSLANVEKRRKKGEVFVKEKKEEVGGDDESEALSLESLEKREERRRFYRVLFDENP